MSTHEFYISVSDLGSAVKRGRRERHLSQSALAEEMGISQSNVSRAENNPARSPETARRIVEHLHAVELDETPFYRVRKSSGSELNNLSIHQSLSYHLRVLFVIQYMNPAPITDIPQEFPDISSEEPAMIEQKEEKRLCIGHVAPGAAQALEDLLNDDLVTFHKFRAFSTEERREQLRRKYEMIKGELGLSRQGVEAAVDAAIQGNVGYQPEGTWRVNDQGNRVPLEGQIVYYSLKPTEKGDEICKNLESVWNRFREGAIKNRLERFVE